MVRLTSEFWVQAYLRRLDLANIPAFVVNKGDATAGAVLIKSNTLNMRAKLMQRTYDAAGVRVWSVLDEGQEIEMDKIVVNQCRFDPDLWVIEVEDRDGRTLLDQEGLFG